MEVNTDIQEPLVDDGGGANPPAGYTPTSPAQRKDWNGFVDYLKSQGNINLNDPQVGTNFLNQYRQNNPNFSITPEMIPEIQYENNQLRSGDSFGNLNADQLKEIRSGMSPNFINTNDVYKSYYPQFKSGSQDYGTNIEDYAKQKFGGSQPTSDPTANTSIAPPISATAPPDSGTPIPPGSIPRPNYDDPTSRLKYAQDWTKKYGPLMQGRGDTPLRINEVPEAGTDTSKNLATKAASKLGIDPALLYSSAMEEGMSGLFPDKNGDIDATKDPKYPVDGFASFGLDNFADAFKGLVKKGYLPADFQNNFKKDTRINEKKEKVASANFKDTDSALQAKAAMMKDTQDQTESFAQKNGISLSPQAKDFFTLINYNAGEANMQKMLKEYARSGYLKEDKFLQNRPSDSWKVPYENVVRRLKMRDALKKEGLF